MAFCPNCGAPVEEGSASCPNCGTVFAAAQQAYAYDPTDHTAEFDAKDISDNKVFAMAAYILGAFGIVIALLAAQKSPYAMFHTRQAVKLNVCMALLVIVAIVPVIGWILAAVGIVIILVVEIILFFQVCQGKAKDAPIIGSFGFLK